MPLYLRILLLFLLNVAVLFGVLVWSAHRQMQAGLQSFLGTMVGANLQRAAEEMNTRLTSMPSSDWPALLSRYESEHGVQTAVFASAEEIFAGSIKSLPAEVSAGFYPRMGPGLGPPGAEPRGARPLRSEGRPPEDQSRSGPPPIRRIPGSAPRSGLDFPKGLLRTGEPLRYWAVVSFPPMPRGEPGPPVRLMLAIATDSVLTTPLLFDPKPWLLGFGGALLFSCLLWLPFVRGITGKLREVKQAARRMADGQLDVRIRENRRDEIGDVAVSVNQMAAQLETIVSGQRRFMQDIAHELCSPLSRMQAAAGVLETGTLNDRQRQYLEALDSDLQQMSHLVNELLQFAKLTHRQEHRLEEVVLDPLIQTVIDRECGTDADHGIAVHVPNDLIVTAEPMLLARAIGNILRNALRYAGGSGPIEITAAACARNKVQITIADHGPGVPPEALPRLFDRFFRTDEARTPGHGGAGLGLAIVKHCVEACGGTVTAANREPSGLRVTLTLTAAGYSYRPFSSTPTTALCTAWLTAR
jgi:two-component system sensor histidine kinase CpxA